MNTQLQMNQNKLEIPMLNENNMLRWLSKIEGVFRGNHYSEAQKLEMGSRYLAEPALSWYNWEVSQQLFASWEEFKDALMLWYCDVHSLQIYGVGSEGTDSMPCGFAAKRTDMIADSDNSLVQVENHKDTEQAPVIVKPEPTPQPQEADSKETVTVVSASTTTESELENLVALHVTNVPEETPESKKIGEDDYASVVVKLTQELPVLQKEIPFYLEAHHMFDEMPPRRNKKHLTKVLITKKRKIIKISVWFKKIKVKIKGSSTVLPVVRTDGCSHRDEADLSTRESASRLLRMASCYLSDTGSCSLLSEFISSVSQQQKLWCEAQHGGLYAIGYVSAHCLHRIPAVSEAVTQNAVKCVVDVVNLETALLASVAMEALGHIGICGVLPLLVNDSSPGNQVREVLQERLNKLLSGDDIKSVQKIALSGGHICSKETSSSHLKISLDLLFSLSRSKAEEILFTAGEALSFLWGGVPFTVKMNLKTKYTSLSTDSNFLMREVKSLFDAKSVADEESHIITREIITGKLFDTLLYSSRKEERCAGTVWMLSLTMYCGQQPSIQLLLPKIQQAFSHWLGDQNELTQELAAQGMSIIYELGEASMKKNLVDALVNTLTCTSKRKGAIKLVEETEVFQERDTSRTRAVFRLTFRNGIPIYQVAPTAAQVHCLQFLIYEVISGGNLRRPGGFFGNNGSKITANDLKQLETFFYKLSFFLHILDYSASIGILTDLGFLWCREFYLESSRVIQFPIECSLPWRLINYILETQNSGLLESVLLYFDIYNDSAQHARVVLRQRFLYDVMEAAVDHGSDIFVSRSSESIITYYKSWSASELLDPSFLFALDNGEKFSIQHVRFTALFKMTKVNILGRTINLRSWIAQKDVNGLEEPASKAEIDKVRSTTYQVCKALQPEADCKTMDKKDAKARVPVSRVFGEIDELKNSLSTEYETQRLVNKNYVLLSLLGQLQSDGMNVVESEKLNVEKDQETIIHSYGMLKKNRPALLEMNRQLKSELIDREQRELELRAELQTEHVKFESLHESYRALHQDYSHTLDKNKTRLRKFSELNSETCLREGKEALFDRLFFASRPLQESASNKRDIENEMDKLFDALGKVQQEMELKASPVYDLF